jgi:hypothetical protein
MASAATNASGHDPPDRVANARIGSHAASTVASIVCDSTAHTRTARYVRPVTGRGATMARSSGPTMVIDNDSTTEATIQTVVATARVAATKTSRASQTTAAVPKPINAKDAAASSDRPIALRHAAEP